MKEKEKINILIAIVVLSLILGFTSIVNLDFNSFGLIILFSSIIIIANILGKNIMAKNLDAKAEHEIWNWSRFGFKNHWKLDKPIPLGVLLPLLGTVFSMGFLKITTLLTYETTALKRRAAKRFGRTSFTEMTDWHIALVGASGIVFVLLISFISYWIPGFELLSKFAAYYAFLNLLPFSKLDGAQIFYGSRVLWSTLVIISTIFFAYALLLI